MAAPPFKVKASYEYKSPHEDDLSFPAGQIITVTEEEDDDWYVGEYTDASGENKSGLFPKNFVERYEPAPPPRPARSARPKPAEAPAPVQTEEPGEPEPPSASVPSKSMAEEAPATSAQAERRTSSISSPPPSAPPSEAQERPPPAPKPAPAAPASSKGPPPPVAEKSSSFRDRIAAFNKPAAAPIAPFKPGGAPTNTFIKKPFVAPPPARNAYVPPPRDQGPQKIYRREEDPEIAERRAQDQEDAEKAGLVPTEGREEEEAPKAVSLKDRIALLQKQQMEQAARRAEHTHKKPKPDRPVKKRTGSYDHEEAAPRDSIDTEGADVPARDSSDIPREAPRPPSARRGPKSPEAVPRDREMFSDGNDADQSAAGETTEDAGTSTLDEDEEANRSHPKAAAAAPPHEEEENEEESTEEEDDMDEETRRQIALRERMAKLSGGMGMAGMFGPQPGMAMPGMGGGLKKKRPTPEAKHVEEPEPAPTSPPQRLPMIPIPGMGGAIRPNLSAEPEEEDAEETEEPADEAKPTSPVRTHTADRMVPVPPKDASTRDSSLLERVPPPVPTEGYGAPEAATMQSPSPGSESDDEMPESALRGAPPPIPTRDIPPSTGELRSPPPPIPTHPSQASPTLPQPTTTSEKRASRAPPPIPGSSPTSPTQTRAAPPPPPGAAPSRSNTSDSFHRRLVGAAGEEGSEYEGDYDTDIASGAKHKDALKAHARESSLDDSTAADDTPLRSPPLSPPIPSGVPRAVPPAPPSQPPRKSTENQRHVPPPVPAEARITQVGGDDEYDPYRYSSSGIPAPRGPPPAPRQAPQLPSMPPPIPSHPPAPKVHDEEEEDEEEPEDEDELYAPPPRTSTDRAPPPLPPHLPPHERTAPPLPPSIPPGAPPPVGPQQPRAPPRQSTDIGGRRSMDQSRPSTDSGFIARDIPLNDGSRWWAQPNTPPSVFQNRSDVRFEIEESSTSKRGGKTTILKDVYVLFNDYSQTVVTAQFDAKNPDDVSLEQRHEPPPARLRQDQLEDAWTRFGQQIARETESKQNIVVGDGTPQALIFELLRSHTSALLPVGTRSYGALVYANLANATVTQNDEIRPGDIVSFRNARFQGKHGSLHAKYSTEAGKPDHVGVVGEWDGTKKKIRAWEQGRESKKVKSESFRLGDLRSGEVKVWRVMPRSWVRWEGES